MCAEDVALKVRHDGLPRGVHLSGAGEMEDAGRLPATDRAIDGVAIEQVDRFPGEIGSARPHDARRAMPGDEGRAPAEPIDEMTARETGRAGDERQA
jgi:hypothetical protein